jgi:predicted RNA-binding protein with PUA-like domain
MSYWLVKTDPDTYTWSDLVRQGRTTWDGVRNHQAKQNLAKMQVGDEVFIYHSLTDKAVVGLAKVVGAPYPEPKHEQWTVVDLAPVKTFSKKITLEQIKTDRILAAMAIVRQSRLSVSSVSRTQAERLKLLARQ